MPPRLSRVFVLAAGILAACFSAQFFGAFFLLPRVRNADTAGMLFVLVQFVTMPLTAVVLFACLCTLAVLYRKRTRIVLTMITAGLLVIAYFVIFIRDPLVFVELFGVTFNRP